ncbi:MAG: phosphate acyltransferase PlsX [Deltaproteobacteria bacterium]|nr:phosphate acyltransferase PlsX [Deltaproteobacteria bacterium]
MPKIAVDAMGGDRAPAVVVEGASLAAKDLGVEIVLVGQKEVIEQEFSRLNAAPLEIVPASQTVEMHESASSALKKRDSSIRIGFDLMKSQRVKAMVSAGNSGAMMATGMFVMGRLPHVARPAILVTVPSKGKGTVIVDAGANVDCKPYHLAQFGIMGAIYTEHVLGVANPRVGVLSNGEEDGKGNELTRAAKNLLASTSLNHIGYVEGRDIFNGAVDVVVCDGFTGNVALKTMEGVASFAGEVLKGAFQKTISSRLGYLMTRKSLREAYRRLDYAEYGGAPLIGLDGVAIVAHGGSNPLAIKNAIRVARDAVEHDMNRHIMEVLNHAAEPEADGKGSLPGKIWRRLRSRIDAISDTPEEPHAREEKEGGER